MSTTIMANRALNKIAELLLEFRALLLDSTTLELLFLPLTELEEFFSAAEELEPSSSLLLDEISPIGSGAELLDSSPHAASRARRMDRANYIF